MDDYVSRRLMEPLSFHRAIDYVREEVRRDSREKSPIYESVEAQVEKDLIPIILLGLGWNPHAKDHVLAKPSDYPDVKRPDIVLKTGLDYDIIVEVKAVGKAHLNIEKNADQVRDYPQFSPMVYLTDAISWKVFIKPERYAFSIDLRRSPQKMIEMFFEPLHRGVENPLNELESILDKVKSWEYQWVHEECNELIKDFEPVEILVDWCRRSIPSRIRQRHRFEISEEGVGEILEEMDSEMQYELLEKLCIYFNECEYQ